MDTVGRELIPQRKDVIRAWRPIYTDKWRDKVTEMSWELFESRINFNFNPGEPLSVKVFGSSEMVNARNRSLPAGDKSIEEVLSKIVTPKSFANDGLVLNTSGLTVRRHVEKNGYEYLAILHLENNEVLEEEHDAIGKEICRITGVPLIFSRVNHSIKLARVVEDSQGQMLDDEDIQPLLEHLPSSIEALAGVIATDRVFIL